MLHCNGIDPLVTLTGNFNWGSFHITTLLLVKNVLVLPKAK